MYLIRRGPLPFLVMTSRRGRRQPAPADLAWKQRVRPYRCEKGMTMTTSVARGARPSDVDTDSRGTRGLLALLRLSVAIMWIENVGWKQPPDYAGLRGFTTDAVEYPVLSPFS